MPVTQSTRLSDALVARTARVLGAQGADGRNAAAWLQAFGIDGQRNLVEEFRLMEITDQAAAQQALDQVHTQLGYLERAFNTGDDPEAVSAIEFIDAERQGTQVQTLTEAMLTAVGVPEGRAAIQRVTEVVSRNAYPRYRDLALVSAGVASVAAPDADSPWARAQIRRILMAVLGREGITFTFDLASTLVAEADRRGVNVPPDLREYLERGASENDIWGTAMRAWSGRALARLHTGRVQDAFGVLLEAARQRTGFVGFSTLALLALINRCIEVGSREAAAHPIWPVAQALNLGQVIHMQPSPQREKLTELLDALKQLQDEIGVQGRDLLNTFVGPADPKNLFEAAVAAAANVRDPDFRLARIELVLNYLTQWRSPTPDPGAAGAMVAELHDQDSQLAYVDQVSARWTIEQRAAAWDGIAAFLPVALGDGTVLDALLARLVGPRLGSLDNQNLGRAMDTCLSDLSGGRPWQVWPAGANPATVGLA
jgi:hypothetical protein